jgi:hypothetical protein
MIVELKLEILLAVMLVPIFFFFNDAYLLICHLQGDSTTGSGTRTDDQYPTSGQDRDSEVATGTGPGPTMTDKVLGRVEKVAGKVTSNTQMYQRGEDRVVS